jgi:hypothetical protein
MAVGAEARGLPIGVNLNPFCGLPPADCACCRHGHTGFIPVIPRYPDIPFVWTACRDPAEWKVGSVPNLRMLTVAEVVAVDPEGIRGLHIAQGAMRELPEALALLTARVRHLSYGVSVFKPPNA